MLILLPVIQEFPRLLSLSLVRFGERIGVRTSKSSWLLVLFVCSIPRSPPVGQLLPLFIPNKPWSHISMDFVVDLPLSLGCQVIWVVVDCFTKMAHFFPLARLPTARALVSLFVRHVFRLHGLPSDIVSDRVPQFLARFWKAFCQSLYISVSLSSAYHPETNGQTERFNQSMKQYLRCYVLSSPSSWVNSLPLAEFAYNNAVHSSSGVSPFFTNFGQHPRSNAFFSASPSSLSLTTRMKAIW